MSVTGQSFSTIFVHSEFRSISHAEMLMFASRKCKMWCLILLSLTGTK